MLGDTLYRLFFHLISHGVASHSSIAFSATAGINLAVFALIVSVSVEEDDFTELFLNGAF